MQHSCRRLRVEVGQTPGVRVDCACFIIIVIIIIIIIIIVVIIVIIVVIVIVIVIFIVMPETFPWRTVACLESRHASLVKDKPSGKQRGSNTSHKCSQHFGNLAFGWGPPFWLFKRLFFCSSFLQTSFSMVPQLFQLG